MASRIKIITDSTSDITPDSARQSGICVVPLNVNFGNKTFKDKIDIDSAAFCELLGKSDNMPMTSLPSPGDFAQVYKKYELEYDAIVSIHISSRLSGTYQSACTAAEEISGCRVFTMDSGLVSSALQLVVLRAARAAAAGCELDDLLKNIRNDIKNTTIYFMLDTLEYLKKGGRIGAAGRMAGSMLNIKPILSVEDGVITPVAKVRSRKQAVRRVMELLDSRPEVPRMAAVGHAVEPDEAQKVIDILADKYHGIEIIKSEIGPVIATHTGPGAVEVSMIY